MTGVDYEWRLRPLMAQRSVKSAESFFNGQRLTENERLGTSAT